VQGRRRDSAALEEKFWRRFVEAVGRPDLADRAYYPAAVAEVEKAVRR